jgi:hypothetical protein
MPAENDRTRVPRWGRICAGLLVALAAGALSSITLARSTGAAASAAYYYCPNGTAAAAYEYCPPTTTTTTTTTPQPPGFMTGGGEFDPSGPCTKASFGGNASGEPGVAAKGHFNYLNHCTGVQVNGPVTEIIAVDPVTKTMTFRVAMNGSCTAVVTWRDAGEPGRNDTIAVTFSGSGCPPPQTSGDVTLDRGNIQWHSTVR